MLFSVCSLCGSLIRQRARLRPCLRERSLGLLAERLLKDHSAGCVWGGLISSYWSLPLLLLVPSPRQSVLNSVNPCSLQLRASFCHFVILSPRLSPCHHLDPLQLPTCSAFHFCALISTGSVKVQPIFFFFVFSKTSTTNWLAFTLCDSWPIFYLEGTAWTTYRYCNLKTFCSHFKWRLCGGAS